MPSFRQLTIQLSPLVFRLTYSYIATVVSLKLLNYSGLANYHFKPNWGLLNGILLFLLVLTLLMVLELRRERISPSPIRTVYVILLVLLVSLKSIGWLFQVEIPIYLFQTSLILIAIALYALYWYEIPPIVVSGEVDTKRSASRINWYWFALIAILLIGVILRAWNLHYLQGTDNFNILAARAYVENGTYFYDGNRQITHIVAWLFGIFGQSWQVARIPMIVFGVASIWLTYFLGSLINKRIGLISAFLLAVSPVAIEKSSFVREYSEAMFWGLAGTLILINIFRRYKNQPEKFIKIYPLSLLLISGGLYFYSVTFNSTAIRANLAIFFFASIPIVYEFLRINFRASLKYFVIVLLICLYLFQAYVYLPLTIFVKGYQFQPYWAQMFFDPQVITPMQWYSHGVIPPAFLIMLVLLPLFILYRKRVIVIFYFVFLANVLLFMFKYNPSGYYHSRYLYHLLPFFIVILSSGLYLLISSATYYRLKVLVGTMVVAMVLMYVTIPDNTIHAAKHDLSIWEGKDSRQPTASGSRNDYLNLIDFLKKQGLTSKDAVAIQGDDQFYITWYFNYPVTKKLTVKYSNGSSQEYDFGDKLYLIDPYKNVDELDLALHEHQTGYLIGHSSNYAEESFDYWKFRFEYLGKAENYKVYRWSERGDSESP